MLTVRRLRTALEKRISLSWTYLAQVSPARKLFLCCACGREIVGFFRYGPDKNWGCPLCKSSPRERLVNAALDLGALSTPVVGRILQIAPTESSLVQRFGRSGELVLGDLHPEVYAPLDVSRVDLMNLKDLGRFDRIYLSHVMEHVPDDKAVLRNLFEALNSAGEVWILVPLGAGSTIDGGPDLSAAERERRFGQWDHVRLYGADVIDRIQAAGFNTSVICSRDMPQAMVSRCGLSEHDKIYVGRKT